MSQMKSSVMSQSQLVRKADIRPEEPYLSDTSKADRNETNQQLLSQVRNLKLLTGNKFKLLQKENSDLRNDLHCMMEMQKQT
tara:strand:+ start:211 stop:456 length:246 start_codon:yes stop_codon:yes gene_type:complete